MYSKLTLYYLNQLGITPWINKEHFLNLNEKENNLLKLVVIVTADLSNKAQMLFKRMLTYINVRDDELLIVEMLTQDLTDNKNSRWWLARIEKNPPCAILVLGVKSDDLFADLNWTCPVIRSFTPEYLLDNPACKKEMFHELHALNRLLSQIKI